MMRWAVFVALLLSSSLACGQAIDSHEDVANRPHPEYDQTGLKFGGFTLLPSFTTAVSATDNYRATNTDRKANVGLLLTPDLTWRSNWKRHRFDGNLFVQQSINTPLKKENATSFGTNLSGIYDISSSSQIHVTAQAARLVEDRKSLQSFRASVEPILYDVLRAQGTYSQTFDRLELQATGGIEHRTYHKAVLANDFHFSQHYRDLRELTFSGTAQYDIGNGIGLIAVAEHDDVRYEFGPGSIGFIEGFSLNRDSVGIDLRAGITLQLTHLIFGSAQVGYLQRKYQDARMPDVSSPSYNIDVLWSVTPLTTILLSGKRHVDESASLTFAGNIRTDLGLKVHHELYRNVILKSELNFDHFRSVASGPQGNEYSMVLGARYLMNRAMSLAGDLAYRRRDSTATDLRFHALIGTLSLRYGL